jgi:ABC-type protease/lipase transport system fused ATPase/permease subunit
MRLPTPRGRLSCEQVVYSPPGRVEPVLRGVSFAVELGTGLGIVGSSAADKSTLCKILVGTWQPTRGSVRLDGADLFAGTVGENIARLRAGPDPDAVVTAAEAAGVHEMILALSQGYDTEIGEAGSHLSGGQRQRIGLARALYGMPRVIVLDEPNASLDADGETVLLRALFTAKSWGATVVIVAHQPRILAPIDKLLLLRHGAVEAFGPREEVLERVRRPRPLEVPAQPSPVPGRAATRAGEELSHAAADR